MVWLILLASILGCAGAGNAAALCPGYWGSVDGSSMRSRYDSLQPGHMNSNSPEPFILNVNGSTDRFSPSDVNPHDPRQTNSAAQSRFIFSPITSSMNRSVAQQHGPRNTASALSALSTIAIQDGPNQRTPYVS